MLKNYISNKYKLIVSKIKGKNPSNLFPDQMNKNKAFKSYKPKVI